MSRAAITLSLVSHTNVGKTTLARTLLRRDVGEVLDQAHVTDTSEAYTLVENDGATLRLWDTPGFGDSARLLKRLRREGTPVVWFLSQTWDRFTDRPFWCGQQAMLTIRDDTEVVLYLLNATESPDDAGYVVPEMELLSWIDRPVVALLNQTGEDGFSAPLVAERVRVWKEHLARWPVVRGVLHLDAFNRCWVEEGALFEHIEGVLPEDRRPLMQTLAGAWDARNLALFERAVEAVAGYLADTAADRENLIGKRPGRAEKKRGMEVLGSRLVTRTEGLMTTLLTIHGLEGRVDDALERAIDAFVVEGEESLDPERGALVGGVVSGALSGLAADLMAGGLSFGGGLVAGAILGALGGAGLARGYEMARGEVRPAVTWSTAFLDRLVVQTVLRYLAVAHFGRGRGTFAMREQPGPWRTAVGAAATRDAQAWSDAWKSIADRASDTETDAETDPESRAAGARRLLQPVRALLRNVLIDRYPQARARLGA